MAELDLDTAVRTDDVPSMPHIAAEVMRLVSDPDISAAKLAAALAKDQSMTARLLQVANSPFYGRSKGVKTGQEAVVLIGYPAVKGLVISTSARHLVKDPGLLEVLLWDQSVGAAFAAHEIARATGLLNPEEAFTAGLLHTITRVVMAFVDRKRYVQVMKQCYNSNSDIGEILQTEQRVFGYTHTDLGSVIAMKWRLGNDLRDAMQFYPLMTPQALAVAEDGTTFSNTVMIVSLASRFTYRLGIGIRMPLEIEMADHVAAQRLKLSADRINEMLIKVKKTFDEQRTHFSLM
jgi:HD-like signal output (HDOD) protein